jgi:hypothetical protein
MEPTEDQVRVLAAALTRLRTASDPTSRVQAVRTATRAVQGLAAEDRQLLVERLLAHGAPVAASAVARHLDDAEVPPVAQTAIAQDLLGLAPIEVARIAEELGEVSPAAPAGAGTAPDPSWPPPTVPSPSAGADAVAPARPAAPEPVRPPTPPPLPRSRSTPRPRTPVLARAPQPAPTARAPASRPVGRSDGDRWSRLAAELADAGDVRARRDVVAALSTPVPSDRLAPLLERVPAGWQRRMVLRRLLTGPGIDGVVPVGTLRVFDRDGDRSAAAALLVRAGLVEVEDLVDTLDGRSLARLRRRAGPPTQGSLLR